MAFDLGTSAAVKLVVVRAALEGGELVGRQARALGRPYDDRLAEAAKLHGIQVISPT